jgi:hypothetical protein
MDDESGREFSCACMPGPRRWTSRCISTSVTTSATLMYLAELLRMQVNGSPFIGELIEP